MENEAKRGDKVSLNTRKRLYFFQDGKGGVSLQHGVKEMDVIPADATENHMKQINRAINTGQLVIGWPETKVETITDNDKDIKDLILLGKNKIEKWVKDLAADKGVASKFKAYKLETLLEMEKTGKNRISVTTILEQQLRYIGGISRIETGEQEKLVIKLTSGNEEEAEKQ